MLNLTCLITLPMATNLTLIMRIIIYKVVIIIQMVIWQRICLTSSHIIMTITGRRPSLARAFEVLQTLIVQNCNSSTLRRISKYVMVLYTCKAPNLHPIFQTLGNFSSRTKPLVVMGQYKIFSLRVTIKLIIVVT